MTTLEQLRIARGAERRLGGRTVLENGQTWFQRVAALIDQAVREGHSDHDILETMMPHAQQDLIRKGD